MRLTRRNALIGLGTVAAGAGVVGGSGAFTSVEANRSVSVTTAGDTGAALAISPADDGDGNATSNASEYTNANDADSFDGDTFEITIGDGDDAGLNIDAVTTIENLFELTNNSPNSVAVDFQIDGDSIPGEFNSINILVGSDSYELSTGDSWAPDASNDGTNDSDEVTIDDGSTYEDNFGIEFDIGDDEPSSFDLELTIRAQEDSS
jgi:hypothetical protein